MIDLTRTTGQKLLFEGKHEQAVPAAMQSLRFAIQVHGLASIELVPSYLILGEASIGKHVFFSKKLDDSMIVRCGKGDCNRLLSATLVYHVTPKEVKKRTQKSVKDENEHRTYLVLLSPSQWPLDLEKKTKS